MKKKLAMLFVVIMILSCMPVMAGTVPGGAAATDTVTAQATKSGWVKTGDYYRYYVNGKYYKNGIYTIGGALFGFNDKGYLQQGFFKVNNRLYYGSKAFGPKGYGIVVTGYQKIGSDYYCFNPKKNGAAIMGFVSFGGKRYYFDPVTCKQYRKKGWFTVGKAMYYVQADGTIATSTTIGGIKVNANGAAIDPYGMDKKAQGYSSDTRYMVMVNKSDHIVNIYKGSKGSWTNIRGNMSCTTGKSSTPTRSGTFKLKIKVTRFGSYGRKDFEASTAFYAYFYNAGNFFHSVIYKKGTTNPYKSNPKDSRLGANRSNGCIRLSLEDAKFMWDTMTVGSRVVIY